MLKILAYKAGGFMPIPRALIRRLAINNEVYTRGLARFEAGCVTNVHYEDTNYVDEYIIKASVEDSGREYDVLVQVDNCNEIIDGFECTCSSFLNYQGACIHIVSLLLSQENVFFNKNIRNRYGRGKASVNNTDETVMQMIKEYSEKATKRTIAVNSGKSAILYPVLKIENDTIKLGLKINCGRTYIVRDIGQFYNNMKNGVTACYGENTMFLHDVNSFDEKSRPLLGIVMTYYADNGMIFNTDKKFMPLKEHMVDKLLSMLCPGEVSLSGDTLYSSISITDEIPDLHINVKKAGKGYFGIYIDNSDYDVIKGRDRIYLKMGNVLHFCPAAYSEKCEPLLTALRHRDYSLTVKDEDMGSLFSSVFKAVSGYIPLKSREDLTVYEPEPLVSKVYLDIDGEGKLTARTDFCYGDKTYSAYCLQREKGSIGDLEGETRIQTVLLNYLPNIDEKEFLVYTHDEDKMYDFLTLGLSELSAYAEIYTSDKLKTMKVRTPGTVGVGVKLSSNLLEILFDTSGFDARELGEIMESYRKVRRYHRLRDGSFLSLENGMLNSFFSIAEGLDIKAEQLLKGKVTVPKYRILYLDGALRNSDITSYERDSAYKKLIRDMKYVADSDFLEPESLKSILRNYQKTGFKWLKTLEQYGFSGILADDMGLGKTLQIIALIKSRKEEIGSVSALVVCPASLALNWESEIKKFAPDITSECIIGTTPERAEMIGRLGSFDVVITSYELLKRDITEYEGYVFDYEIIDEAQYIKNHLTQNAKAAKTVMAKTRFALTGTPIENNLSELWSIFDFLMPGYLFNHTKFRQRFESPIIRHKDEAALDRLRLLVAPFILRRLKSEVLKELPEKSETVLFAKFDDEQKKLYAANALAISKEFREKMQHGSLTENRFMVLAMLMRLRQLCCNPTLVYENYTGESAKLELCISLIENLISAGHKMLLFSQFTSMLDILEKRLDKMNIPHYLIRGSTKKAERLSQVNKFNEDDTPVFLISLKAGGTGLNLTGADMVIHYDPWWNMSVQNQATDRVHRIGQKKSVQVYKLIVKDSIEEKILNLQQRKANLADSVITDGEFNISSMTEEELLRLFEIT